MRNIRKSITFFGTIAVLLFVVCSLFSFAAVPNGNNGNNGSNDGSDAVYLEKEICYTLNPDGSWEKDYRHRLKLNTYYAVNRTGGETFIVYNPQYQELKVLKSETTMKGGRKVPSPANAFNEVLPSSAHYFPHYVHLREMVVTHTGLERGAIIDLHYRINTKADFMPYFSGKEFISANVPIRRLVLKIAVPTGQKLNYQLFYAEAKPVQETSNKMDIYTFSFENLASFLEELPNKTIGQAYMIFSTASTWENIFPPAEETGPLPAEWVKKLADLKSLMVAGNGDEFYFKLQALVSDEIDSCNIGPDANGFAVRKLQEAFDSNYATSIEKAYLLYRLIKQLDLPVEILALPFKGAQPAQDVPTMLQFNEFLIRINESGRAIYLNPCKKDDFLFPYSEVDTTVFNLQEKKFSTIKCTDECQNQINISGNIKVGAEDEKSTGELELSLNGYFYPYRSTLEDAQKALLKVIEEVLPIDKLEIKKITLLSQGKLNALAAVEGDFFKTVSSRHWQLEKYQFPYITEGMISLPERKYPLRLEVPFRYNINISLKLPESLEIVFLSPQAVVKNDLGFYEQQVLATRAGFIDLKMALAIERPTIVSQAYPEFREILARYFIKEPLVIVKKKG